MLELEGKADFNRCLPDLISVGTQEVELSELFLQATARQSGQAHSSLLPP